ncbi:MAG: TonB-dependent receptor plug domain-containing protein [Candidatus Wallbacteria bacterium]|nr:TonB-dependent receptor plug domain-containing protein [Candidatus Wallbacteria bacterium]
MKSVFFAACSLLFLLTASFPTAATGEVTLNPVVISASRLPQSSLFLGHETVVCDRSASESVADLLYGMPGLNLSLHNTPGALSTIKIAGTDPKHTLVRFGHAKLNDAFNGMCDLSLIDPVVLSAVQIVRQSASSVHGGEAPGGVVELRGRGSNEEFLRLDTGSFGSRKISFGLPAGRQAALIASHWDLEGDREGSNGRQNTLYGSGFAQDMNWQFLFTDRNIGTPGTVKSFLWNTPGDRQGSSLRLFDLSWRPHHSIRAVCSDSSYSLAVLDASMGKENTYESDRFSLELTRHWSTSVIGLQYEHMSGKAAIFSDNDFDNAWDATVDSIERIDRDENCLSFFGEKAWRKLYLSARHDSYDLAGSQAGLNAAYQEGCITMDWFRGYRLPTFNDMYWPTGGNPSLDTERNTGAGLTIAPAHWLKLRGFTTSYLNLIQWAPLPSGVWTPQNVGSARVRGLECRLQHENLSVRINWEQPENRQDRSRLLYKELRSGRIDWTVDSGHDRSRQQTVVSYVYHGKMRMPDDFDAAFNPLYCFRNGTGVWEVTLRSGSDGSRPQTVLTVHNLFDKQLITVKDYPAVGRSYRLGIEFSW